MDKTPKTSNVKPMRKDSRRLPSNLFLHPEEGEVVTKTEIRRESAGSTSPLSFDDKSLLGDGDSIWEMIEETLYSDHASLPPVPFHVLAAGAPVDADDIDHEGGQTFNLPPPPPVISSSCRNVNATSSLKRSASLETRNNSNHSYEWTDDRKLAHASSNTLSDTTVAAATANNSVMVGPNSVQMKTIKRMIVYLQEKVRDDKDDQDAQTWLHAYYEVVHHCELRHARGEFKYRHLPGAIFEKLVERIGGPAFGKIYHETQCFDHPRLQELNLLPDDPRAQKSLQQRRRMTPSILHLAVGYGLHLAHQQQMAVETSQHGPKKNVQELVQHGASAITNMTEHEQGTFWNYLQSIPQFQHNGQPPAGMHN